MYSQQDLDEAVAAGAINADAAASLRNYLDQQPRNARGRRRAVPADHQLQRHLRLDRRADPAVRGRLDRPVDRPVARPDRRRRRPDAARARRSSPRPPGAWPCSSPRERRMALPSILLLLAFVGGVFAATAFRARRCRSATGSSTIMHRSAAILGAVAAAIAARRRLAPLAPLPRADHRRGRRRGGRRHRRRPDRRGARRPARATCSNVMLGFVLLLGVGVFLFAMRWDSSDQARVTRRTRRRLLAAPARRADDRPPGLHPARPQRRQCHDRRGAGRDPALRRARRLPRWRSTAAPCSSRRWPMCSTR